MGNKSWVINGKTGFDALSFSDAAVPAVGDNDVLVKRKHHINLRNAIPSLTQMQSTVLH